VGDRYHCLVCDHARSSIRPILPATTSSAEDGNDSADNNEEDDDVILDDRFVTATQTLPGVGGSFIFVMIGNDVDNDNDELQR